ncbi:ribonucleoside-diphosphate reductase [Candidatus Dependentiae bacterium Noda2021]|nr:ribonucleoside-diphosphate reductase [Candidatus Dependentiae bacterium Noda2021]
MASDRHIMKDQPFFVSQNNAAIKSRLDQTFKVTKSGNTEPFDIAQLYDAIVWACARYDKSVSIDLIAQEVVKTIFDGITPAEIEDALILATVSYIEHDPNYNFVAAQFLLKKLFKEVTGTSIRSIDMEQIYKQYFVSNIKRGVEQGIFDKRLLEFDLEALAQGLRIERDGLFEYMGLRTLYERYFAKIDSLRIEMPQMFWMRVAMGVSLLETNKTEQVLEFYELVSNMDYVPSTPTLLHSGLVSPQLSSCYLTTIQDDLHNIFKCLGDNAQLSKWSGGLANDWSNVRATGAMVKSIKTESQGVIPYLKIANDVTAAINRSGKRRSAAVVYLELWHFDIEDFLDLRRNVGDERRRTHDINTATWIPDLFMKRLLEDGNWTLFSPDEVPDLHHIYGRAFEARYQEYEQRVKDGSMKLYKVIKAADLWRKMLSRLFETGHPWITFKDPSNIRSPQDHAGVVHSSNLCTEITLNTSADETAVCNLGSINLTKHVTEDGQLDVEKLAINVHRAIRMLDNVIDINFYPTIEARNANFRHRPIGLGLMGLQDALYKLDINFDSPEALKISNNIMEIISYNAILASSMLAKERGAYESYKGSKWDRGIFPQDTITLLEQERNMAVEVNRTGILDWEPVRKHVRAYGMRNSNTMAIAPTATISNISGCFPCIEPIYKNIYVKANMTGEFTVVNKYLVEDLKKLGLWDHDMLELLKYFDGSVQNIERIPQKLKDKYKEVFEIDPEWLVKLTAERGIWIDQSQSHNVFMKGVSGKKLNAIYIAGWKAGLKTFYYLRTLGASQIEKSTLDAKKFGYTQKREYTTVETKTETVTVETQSSTIVEQDTIILSNTSCSISADPECEVCQ